MKLLFLLFIYIEQILCNNNNNNNNDAGCSINIHGDFEKKSPLILNNQASNFILPINGKINLKKNENITIVCPDNKNILNISKSNLTYAVCDKDEHLLLINKNVLFKNLQCKKIIKGTVISTDISCSKNGTTLAIGYNINKNKIIALIGICYDYYFGTTLFSQHFLYGQDIYNSSKTNYRPSFSSQGLPRNIAASVVYKKSYQKSTFNKLLGSTLLASNYINEKSFLARGHLSPDADFLFAATQYTSYYYINAIPQWQVINAGNWKKIESMVRKLAGKLSQTFKITTGIYDTLTLTDSSNKQVGIYLIGGNKLPVAKYIWKVIFSESTKKAIVLIILNNPFAKKDDSNYEFCLNVCKKFNWYRNTWDNYEHGLVFCCDYWDFVRIVGQVPNISPNNILYGPDTNIHN